MPRISLTTDYARISRLIELADQRLQQARRHLVVAQQEGTVSHLEGRTLDERLKFYQS